MQGTRTSSNGVKATGRIHRASFEDEKRRPCFTFAHFNAHDFTDALIVLIGNQLVLPHGIEP